MAINFLSKKKRSKKRSKHKGGGLDGNHLINENSRFGVIESYNGLRTNIMFSLTKTNKGKIILITSSVPGEGKTTTSINTAITFAQSGARVLLIDCDLRKSTIHRYLKLDGSVGLTNVLCGYNDIASSIHRNVFKGVDVLTVGEIPPNPTQMLSSPEMGNLLAALSTKYDYIFLDTPPVSVVTDAALIAAHCAGVAVVVREDFTNLDRLDVAVSNLKKANAHIMGFIMLTNERQRKRYGYYGKYSNYGKYGYYASYSSYDSYGADD